MKPRYPWTNGKIAAMIQAMNSELKIVPPAMLPLFSKSQAEQRAGMKSKAAASPMNAPKMKEAKAKISSLSERERILVAPILCQGLSESLF